MDSVMPWGLLALAVVLLCIVAAVFVARSRRSDEQKAFDQQLRQTRERHDTELKELKARLAQEIKPFSEAAQESEREYSARVAAARKELATAQKEHAKRVKQAEKALKSAEEMGSREIDSIRGKEGKVSVTGLELRFGRQTHPLTPDIEANVDATGSRFATSRTTATRVVGGALIAGPAGAIVGAAAKKGKVHDDRELYLSISGPDYAYVLTLSPNLGKNARTFASHLLSAARQVSALRDNRDRQIQQAQTSLEAARSDTTAIDSATANLNLTSQDSAQRDADKEALDAEKARTAAAEQALVQHQAAEREQLYAVAREQGLTLPRRAR